MRRNAPAPDPNTALRGGICGFACVAVAVAWSVGCVGGDRSPRSTEAAVLTLLESAAADARDAMVERGANLFARMSCATCHAFDDTPMTGPRLDRLFIAPVKLADGRTLDADRPYLWRSIATPHAELVDGYQTATRMTNFGHVLTDADVAALIAFMESRNGR